MSPGRQQKCLKAQGIILDTSHRAFIDTTTLEKRDFGLVRFPSKSLCWLHVSSHVCMVKAASVAAGSTSQANGTVFLCYRLIVRTAPGTFVISPKNKKVKTSLFPYDWGRAVGEGVGESQQFPSLEEMSMEMSSCLCEPLKGEQRLRV